MEIVAIVGQPNVGKSSLFNRLCGGNLAITHPTPGVTRNRHYGPAEWFGKRFYLVDTGGFLPPHRSELPMDALQRVINDQVEYAIHEAAMVLFCVDGVNGLTPVENEIAGILRRSGRPVFLVVNKIDGRGAVATGNEFFELGFNEIHRVSALHGTGVADMIEAVLQQLEASIPQIEPPEGVNVCFLGKPNVGKSSLFNLLVGENRSIVHHLPGTTRDNVLVPIQHGGRPLYLVDTAGVRRWARRESDIEQYSVIRALAKIKQSDVIFFTLDAQTGITQQDQVLASQIADMGSGVVILFNKWDLVEKDANTIKGYTAAVKERLGFLDHAPILTVSAVEGTRVNQLLTTLESVLVDGDRVIPEAELREFLRELVILRPPPARHMAHHRLLRLYKKPGRGARFVLTATDPKCLHFSYVRYIKNALRQRYPFRGWPLKLNILREEHATRDPA